MKMNITGGEKLFLGLGFLQRRVLASTGVLLVKKLNFEMQNRLKITFSNSNIELDPKT